MKDSIDNKTIDMLPPAKRGRGRPVTGMALSAAERKAAQRARLVADGKVTRTYTLSADVAAALDRFIQFKDEDKSAVVDRIIRDRLMRKR